MTTITLQQLQQDASALLARVAGGESLLVTRDGQPVAELHPVASPVRQPRPFGLCAGEFSIPDDFDAPLPEEVLKEFEGR